MSTATTTSSVVIDGYTFNIAVTVTSPSTGIQASRIADLLEPFGVNTFSSLDGNSNLWGSWPADYSPPTVIAAMNWLTNNSGLTMRGREYHYAGRETMQAKWLSQVTAGTGSKFSICVGSNGDLTAVPTLLSLAAAPENNVGWIEGSNEPNNDFGSGQVPSAVVQDIQTQLFAGRPPGVEVLGPSIVFGMPYPEGYILPAYVPSTTSLSSGMTLSNGHFYPPRNPDIDDGSGRGGSFDDVVVGLTKVYGKKPVITEWHPTLYNNDGHSSDDMLAAYLTPINMLSANRLGVSGMWWYSLFDYGSTYKSGLFPTNATNPRPAAYAIRAMYSLTGDKGQNKRTFSPGKLAYTVSGLPSPVNAASPHTGGQHALFQSSDGRFFLFLWNSQLTYGGPKVPVTVKFGSAVHSVSEYNLNAGATAMTALQSLSNVSGLTSQLDASARLLVVSP